LRLTGTARLVDYPEGAVVFDPVAGVVRILSGESRLILDYLSSLIGQGVTGRTELLDALLEELQDDGEPVDDTAKLRLALWVDLARHVIA
jgi:hypothetical protein